MVLKPLRSCKDCGNGDTSEFRICPQLYVPNNVSDWRCGFVAHKSVYFQEHAEFIGVFLYLSLYMIVPTCSPFNALVILPSLRPLMIWISFVLRERLSSSTTILSTTRSSGSLSNNSAAPILGMNSASGYNLGLSAYRPSTSLINMHLSLI